MSDAQEAEFRAEMIRKFEATQNGVDVKFSIGDKRKLEHGSSGAEHSTVKSVKPKLDNNNVKEKDDKEKEEEDNNNKPVMPAYWLPALAPSLEDSNAEIKEPIKLKPLCPVGGTGKGSHLISLKLLVDIKFTEESKDGSTRRICYSCKKELSNTSKPQLLRRCGHVLCKNCCDKFIKEDQLCLVCDTSLFEKSEDKKGKMRSKSGGGVNKQQGGMIELHSGGSGFAAGGNKEVEYARVNFQ